MKLTTGDKIVDMSIAQNFIGGTLSLIGGYAPLRFQTRCALVAAGLTLSVTGTIIGWKRIDQMTEERTVKAAKIVGLHY